MLALAAAAAARVDIGDEDRFRRRPLVDRHDAGHAMDRGAADRRDVIERAGEGRVEIALAAGQRGKPEFRALRRVDAELRQAMPLSSAFTADGGDVIGKLQLDGRKARRRRGAETLDQRAVGEQMAEIGGKARHFMSLAFPLVG